MSSRTIILSSLVGLILIAAAITNSATARQHICASDCELAILQGSDKEPVDWFGYMVSMSGRRLAASALFHDGGLDRAGAVYIFEEDAGGTWVETAAIKASDRASVDLFGVVALDGDRLMVGAPNQDWGDPDGPLKNAGAVYVYEFDPASGSWVETAKLKASDADVGDRFGDSVALDGDIAVVGADFEEDPGSNSGAAYVFEHGSDGAWTETAKLEPPDHRDGQFFGYPIALDGDRLLIGAGGFASGSGSAYMYERSDGGVWELAAKLENPDPSLTGGFSNGVALDGDTAVLGAPYGENREGAAFVFERYPDGSWNHSATLQSDELMPEVGLGYSVAIQGDVVALGTNMDDRTAVKQGWVYLFERQSDGSWRQRTRLEASNHGPDYVDQYGWSVSFGDGVLAVGAFVFWTPSDPNFPNQAGSAYIIDVQAAMSVARERVAEVPAAVTLEQNWPNPFNPETRIAYTLDRAGSVALTVFDGLGRVVYRADRGFQAPGRYEVPFTAHDLPTGVYTYVLSVDGHTASRSMVLLR